MGRQAPPRWSSGAADPPPEQGRRADDLTGDGRAEGAREDPRVPPDATELGYADLAEHRPTDAVSEFQELRDRLFGDVTQMPTSSAPTDSRNSSTSLEHSAEFSVAEHPRTEPDDVFSAAVGAGPSTSVELATVETSVPAGPAVVPAEPVVKPTAEPKAEPEVATVAESTVEPVAESTVATVAEPTVEPVPTLPTGSADVPPHAPVMVPVDDEPRRRTAVLAVVGVLAVAFAAAAGWWLLGRPGDDSPVAGTSSVPPRVTSVSSTVVDATTVTIRERMEFARPTSSVTLAIADTSTSEALTDFTPSIREVSVTTSEGTSTHGPLAAGEPLVVPLPAGTERATVDYAVAGVVLSSDRSTGRVLAWVTPLDIVGSDGVRTVVVTGDVLNLGCVEDDGSQRACGRETDDGWAVQQRTYVQAVVAQVDVDD